MDLQKDWPLIGAGGLALAGVFVLSKGGGTQWTVQNTDTSGAVAVAQAEIAQQTAHEQSLNQTLGEVLQYETAGHSLDAQTLLTEMQLNSANYQAGLATAASEFSASAQADAISAQAQAQVDAVKAAKPSWWQSFFAAASAAVSAYFGKPASSAAPAGTGWPPH